MQDQIVVDHAWTFDADVTTVFDDMLARSIPQYEVMRKAVLDLACLYAQRQTAIIDLGSSRGEAVASLIDRLGDANQYYCCEISEPMLDVLRQRFADRAGYVHVLPIDLRQQYPAARASVTLSILTLQFTPIEYRQQILRRVYNNTTEGGAFILVEKVLGDTADVDETMVRLYYALKGENGYTTEQIERKRLSLEGVLVPVTARWNEELLRMAGFKQVDCFWRWMNFAGWIALK